MVMTQYQDHGDFITYKELRLPSSRRAAGETIIHRSLPGGLRCTLGSSPSCRGPTTWSGKSFQSGAHSAVGQSGSRWRRIPATVKTDKPSSRASHNNPARVSSQWLRQAPQKEGHSVAELEGPSLAPAVASYVRP